MNWQKAYTFWQSWIRRLNISTVRSALSCQARGRIFALGVVAERLDQAAGNLGRHRHPPPPRTSKMAFLKPAGMVRFSKYPSAGPPATGTTVPYPPAFAFYCPGFVIVTATVASHVSCLIIPSESNCNGWLQYWKSWPFMPSGREPQRSPIQI